jgi:hypothetical protein
MMEGFNATQIHRKLGQEGLFKGHPLSLRTIQRMVREFAPIRDESGPWSLSDADPEEARLVVDVLFQVLEANNGREWLTKDIAASIVRIRTASPSIPPTFAYRLSRFARSASAQSDSRALDITLGARPWESSEREKRWFQVLVETMGDAPSLAVLMLQCFSADEWRAKAERWGVELEVSRLLRFVEWLEDFVSDKSKSEPPENAVDNNLTTEPVDDD